MYSLPSASNRCAPAALSITRGSPPTALKARTGLLTPPTSNCSAWRKISCERLRVRCVTGFPRRMILKGAGETPALQRWFPNHRRAAAIQIRFFAPPWPSRLTRLEPPGGIFGVVSEHDISSGALDSSQDFQHHALLLEPPVARGRFNHRVFPADVIGCDRNLDVVPHQPHNVEIRQRRLDHHHVRAFLDIQRDFTQDIEE